jgi:pyrimidine operon attenuation protein/uracil phosphoribosyltransferase
MARFTVTIAHQIRDQLSELDTQIRAGIHTGGSNLSMSLRSALDSIVRAAH